VVLKLKLKLKLVITNSTLGAMMMVKPSHNFRNTINMNE